jgi:hypothetical protein
MVNDRTKSSQEHDASESVYGNPDLVVASFKELAERLPGPSAEA